jgi:hypothetical protein
MSDDDVVTAVLVSASIAGPAILALTTAARRKTGNLVAPSGAHALLFLVGGTLTFFGWLALAGWWWLSSVHWGML